MNCGQWIAVFYHAVHGILWVDPPLTTACLLMVLATLIFAREVWLKPIFVSSLLAIGGYSLFITLHQQYAALVTMC